MLFLLFIVCTYKLSEKLNIFKKLIYIENNKADNKSTRTLAMNFDDCTEVSTNLARAQAELWCTFLKHAISITACNTF